MAQVGSITAESSSSEFLEQTKTEELANKFTSGKIATIADEFIKVIQEHKDTKGLSRRALSIEGRSPLNEIANEMIARLQVTVTDVEAAGKIATARGNNHTNQEAEKFLDEVLKKYEELCKKVDEALKSCENASYQTTEDDGDGGTKTVTHHCKNGITVKYSINGASTSKITKSGSRDSNSHFDDEYAKFDTAFKDAESCYDGKVKEAIDFYNANGKGALPTDGAKGLSLAMPNDETRPEGVQPDAKKTVDTDLGGRLQTITYTNPDGSTVKITKVEGKIKEHKVMNRQGYTTETYKYDDDGNMTHKNVWEYKKVEGKDRVYESSYTKYVKNSSGEWEAVGEPKSYGYSYPVENDSGNVSIENQKGGDIPDDSKVAKRGITLGGVSGTSDSGSGSGEVSDNSGTKAPTSSNVLSSHKDAKEKIKKHEDFVLKVGDEIHIDQFGGKGTFQAFAPDEETGDYHFKYNDKAKLYYVFDEKGNFVVGNYNQQKTMDPDKFLKGSNTKQIEGSLWTNDSGYFSKQELDDHNELMGK